MMKNMKRTTEKKSYTNKVLQSATANTILCSYDLCLHVMVVMVVSLIRFFVLL